MKHMMVLITYHFKSSQTPGHEGFHCDVATSATDWIEAMEQLVFSGNNDGTDLLINVLPITNEQVARYDGNLQSM
jgi:hypothetical protein